MSNWPGCWTKTARSVVAKAYPLALAADAHRALEGRGTQGKLGLEGQAPA